MSPMRAVGEQVTLIEGSSEGYSQPAFMGVAAVFALPGVFRLSLLLSVSKTWPVNHCHLPFGRLTLGTGAACRTGSKKADDRVVTPQKAKQPIISRVL